MRTSRARFFYCALTCLATAATACSSDHGVAAEGAPEGATGKLDVALDIAPGVTLTTVSYSITGPSSFSKTGSFDVTNSTTITATIGPIPAATGYTVTLSTTAGATCSGSANFDITAHQTTPVTVHMSCKVASTNGSVQVNGALNVCPQLDGVQATPSEVLVSGSVGLSATAHDSDNGPSPLTYAWTSDSGTFTDATAANTRFTCTAPGTANVTVTVSDGDASANCPATSTVQVTCTGRTASTSCQLGNGAGSIQHVIYLQFDNTHLTRDRTSVPSDLEQMPNLLNFIRNNGTMMANDHTILISHTAGGFLSSFTGVYPDRHGQTVTNSYERTTSTGTFTFPSSFAYWTDPVSGTIPNMVTPDGSNAPAPWVHFTRAGCDFGAVAGANIVLENTGTTATGDMTKVFGMGSPQYNEAVTSNGASSGTAARNLAQTDFVGLAVHCAQGSSMCANGEADLLPQEPGGYSGFNGLFGAQQIDPILTGQAASVPLTDMLGNPITDPFGQPGFPGFDGMEAAVTLAYVAKMQEHGIPVTYGYISDAHDFHGVAGNAHVAYGPGAPGYEQQLHDYDTAFGNFFTELAAHGIDKSNTLFIITVDEGDHFAGGTPTPANCDGVTTPCDWTTNNQVGEINTNIDTLVQHQFPALYSQFLASGAPDNFTVHGDSAPTFYLAKRGSGPLGQTDPDTRNFERTIAGLTAVNPYTGNTDTVLAQMADQTGMKAMHMFTTGDPVRNPTFVFFADANYFITDYPSSTCETCIGNAYAWNHGDIQREIGQTWIGFVGPGVASQPDQTIFTDHTDVRPTIDALVGVRTTYQADGRVITQALVNAAVPPAIAADKTTAESLGDYYKRINAPFGQFSMDMATTSTKALRGSDSGDATYTSKEASIASLTAQRDALAAQIRGVLDNAEFAGMPIDATQAASFISQATALLSAADALAAAP
ncbi:MAG TPA: hypothetical protein VHC69_05245 [Polyangiaceae bacterium]|nr:hypothetical protein [Polyangiaceae bacterium]